MVRPFLLASALACSVSIEATEAHGQGREKEATELYTQGSEHAKHDRCDQAIPLLERSYTLLESPNTALVLGRCLRETGSVEEAYQRYDTAVTSAQDRVAHGKTQYAQTEKVAKTERDALRASLGIVTVKNLQSGDRVEAYRLRIEAVDPIVTMYVRPGATKVRVTRAGVLRELPVTVTSGSESIVELPRDTASSSNGKKDDPTEPPMPREKDKEKEKAPLTNDGVPGWIVPTATVSAILAALGVGTFVFFGLRSEAVYSDLEACQPACPDSKRDDAQTAAREQTIANIGLAVGAAFAVAATTLILYRLSFGPSSQKASLSFSPAGLKASF